MATTTTPFKIESGVPMPGAFRSRTSIYPFGQMKKGDSFLVPCTEEEAPKKKGSISNSVVSFRKGPGNDKFKFAVRLRPEEKGVRCWRTA